jgi:hypothetical protein
LSSIVRHSGLHTLWSYIYSPIPQRKMNRNINGTKMDLSFMFLAFVIFLKIATNGLQLPTVGGLKVQNCLERTKMKRTNN